MTRNQGTLGVSDNKAGKYGSSPESNVEGDSGVDNGHMKRIKKRKYSRDGCKECKRRKMKCDEGKPFCYNCSRLRKQCEYEVKQKFRFETFAGVDVETAETTGKRREHATGEQGLKKAKKRYGGMKISFEYDTNKSNGTGVSKNGVSKKTTKVVDFEHKPEPIPTMSYPLGSPDTQVQSVEIEGHSKSSFKNSISDILSTSNEDISVPTLDFDSLDDAQRLLYEASLLVNDMNELVADDLVIKGADILYPDRSNSTFKNQLVPDKERSIDSISESFEKHNFHLDEFKDTVSRSQNTEEVDKTSSLNEVDLYVSNAVLVNEIIKNNRLTGVHITYLKSLVQTNLSYHLFPFASSIESNEVVKILLHYSRDCPYLLSSLLAISSTFQFNQTGKRVHDVARQKYITACLKLLSEVFLNNGTIHHNLANNIERLLFTVLVLSSNFTSTSYSNKDNIINSWKVHLKGAQDLFVKYSRISKQQGFHKLSCGLALAKTWFFAIESIAGLNAFQGGATSKSPVHSDKFGKDILTDDNRRTSYELFDDTGYFNVEANPQYHDALVRLRLLVSDRRSSRFNIYLGFSIDVVILMRELIRGLDYIRARGGRSLSSTTIAKIFSLIHQAKQTEIVPQVDKERFTIPKSSPAHPEFPGNRVILPPSAYVKEVDKSGNTVYYSWFDLSEQLHVDLVYLKLLTSKGMLQLSRRHPLVQDVVKRILGSMIFVKPKSDPNYEKAAVFAESENFYISKDLFDIRCIMVQSPFSLCSKLVHTQSEFEIIELYLMGLVKLGNGSALNALDNLTIFRERRKRSNFSMDSTSEDEIIYGLETIPFA